MDGKGPDIENHENHAHDIISSILPTLVYYNPKVRVQSSRPKAQRELTGAMTHGLNRWIRDIKFADNLELVALDVAFDFGVTLTTLEPLPGYEDHDEPPLRPRLTRISPRRYFCDPQANSKTELRFEGHEQLRDLDDLKRQTEIDPETGKARKVYSSQALEKIGADDSTISRRDSIMEGQHGLDRIPRNQVRVFEVYVREHGKIYTLGVASGGKENPHFLREPRDYYGPPTGPYTLFGIYVIPDQIFPLPILAVTANLVDELNAHIDQVADQADKAKQVTLVNASNTNAIHAVKNAGNGEIICIPGFDRNQVADITIGGPSPECMDYVDRLRERLDRKSGMAEFQRGNVTGDATATENQLAAAAMDHRRKYMKRGFQMDCIRVLEKAAWYLANSENVVFPVPITQAEVEGGRPGKEEESEDYLFAGGPQPGQDGFDFNDLELEIEPYSMEAVDEGQISRQRSQFFALIMQAVPVIPQTPFVNWPDLLDDLGQAINIPDGRKYINWEMVQQMLGMEFAPGQPKTMPGLDGIPPVMARTLATLAQGQASGRGYSRGGQQQAGGLRSGQPADMSGVVQAMEAMQV